MRALYAELRRFLQSLRVIISRARSTAISSALSDTFDPSPAILAEIPMQPSAAKEWYQAGSRRPRNAPGVNLIASSGTRWRGVCVDLADASPGELPEGSLKAHALVSHTDSARTDVRYAGKAMTGECLPGDICIVPAEMAYSVRRHDPGRMILATIQPHMIVEVMGEDLAAGRLELRPVFRQRDLLMDRLIAALGDQVLLDNPGGRLYADALGVALVAHLAQTHGRHIKSAPGALSDRELRIITDYIEARLDDSVSLHDLAKLVGMSQWQLSRRFKQCTGMPPHQYLMHRRIERAKVLLLNRKLSVLEVALACGFTSQSHFDAAFRLNTGRTPSLFRNKL